MSVAVQTGEAIGPGRARLRPGSFLWLLSYDLTMSWRRVRGMFASLQTSAVVLIVFGALLSFHLVA